MLTVSSLEPKAFARRFEEVPHLLDVY